MSNDKEPSLRALDEAARLSGLPKWDVACQRITQQTYLFGAAIGRRLTYKDLIA